MDYRVALSAGTVFAAIALVAYVLRAKEKLRKTILRRGSEGTETGSRGL